MILLAIDTSSTRCAAGIYDVAADKELGRAVLELGKGHAEHLMGVVNDAMRQAGVDFPGLGRLVVSVGPGSFTGVRVGVSTARGFAMALKIPAVGVTTLEAIAAEAREALGAKTVMAALDAGRGEINAAVYDQDGVLIHGPAATTLGDAAALARKYSTVLAGSAAALIAGEAAAGLEVGSTAATADVRFYARLGAAKPAGEKPKPLYLREADAKPQAGFVLPRIRHDGCRKRLHKDKRSNLMRIPFLTTKTRDYVLEPLTPEDSPAIASIHHEDFVRPWTDGEFESLLGQDTVFGFAARETGRGGAAPVGFILARLAAGEGEILTVAVTRAHRRQGLGWRLMDAVLRELHGQRAEALFLEVDETNAPAIALYRRLGFFEVGKRPRYYESGEGKSGALVMRRDLR